MPDRIPDLNDPDWFSGPTETGIPDQSVRLEADQGGQDHFHGCPTPIGHPFHCDYCQARAAAMSGAL